jgi:hypothetical protein
MCWCMCVCAGVGVCEDVCAGEEYVLVYVCAGAMCAGVVCAAGVSVYVLV